MRDTSNVASQITTDAAGPRGSRPWILGVGPSGGGRPLPQVPLSSALRQLAAPSISISVWTTVVLLQVEAAKRSGACAEEPDKHNIGAGDGRQTGNPV